MKDGGGSVVVGAAVVVTGAGAGFGAGAGLGAGLGAGAGEPKTGEKSHRLVIFLYILSWYYFNVL